MPNRTKTKKRQMNKLEFFALLEYIAEKNSLKINDLIAMMDQSLRQSFARNFDPDAKIEVVINPEKKDFKLINHNKFITASEVSDPKLRAIEINIKDALKINPEAKVGDLIAEEVSFSAYSNSLAEQISQFFRQKLNAEHKKVIFSKYKDLKGQIIKAEVLAVYPSYVLFKIDNTVEAFMPNTFRNHRQNLGVGQIVEVYVEDVRSEGKGSQIIVSNGSKEIVRRFLEMEIPEIKDGAIEIIAISREPGVRSKIAVKNIDPNVDPLGAIVGPRGSRINLVSEHLFHEKIDVIKWSGDINEFISNALNPAKVVSIIDKESGDKIAVVPNRQNSLAIGRSGVNVKLAVNLTNHKIDIVSLNAAKEKGLPIEWNGNITPEMLEKIEAGERITHFNSQKSNFMSAQSLGDFDQDISLFTANISELDSKKYHQKDSYSSPQRPARKNTGSSERHHSSKAELHNDYVSEVETNFDYESNDIFSDEDLKQMEKEFGFDPSDINYTDFENEEPKK